MFKFSNKHKSNMLTVLTLATKSSVQLMAKRP